MVSGLNIYIFRSDKCQFYLRFRMCLEFLLDIEILVNTVDFCLIFSENNSIFFIYFGIINCTDIGGDINEPEIRLFV